MTRRRVFILVMLLIITSSIFIVQYIVYRGKMSIARSSAQAYVNITQTQISLNVMNDAGYTQPSIINDVNFVTKVSDKPTEMELHISDGNVVSGYIIINNYRFNISSDGTVK